MNRLGMVSKRITVFGLAATLVLELRDSETGTILGAPLTDALQRRLELVCSLPDQAA